MKLLIINILNIVLIPIYIFGCSSMNKPHPSPIPAFEYREPYFIENNSIQNRKKFNTQHLENEWEIWGHNLPKFIEIKNSMFAQINGKITNQQICFSSLSLEKAFIQKIEEISKTNAKHKKYMIAPLDNHIVCQCNTCIELGNTPKNASPAVFNFINKIAAKFSDIQFFGIAYETTYKQPKITLKPNVGVMITTMSFPKGIDLKKTKQFEEIKAYFDNWKSLTKKIYLWEYVIHFDNYFEQFPTLKITQENLKTYYDFGVKGVFLHGTEETYSVYSDLKYEILAKLLSNLNIDIKEEIITFYQDFYPISGKIISEYLINCEYKSLNSRFQLDFYGGIHPIQKKYLEHSSHEEYLEQLNQIFKKTTGNEKERLSKIILAETYQQIEIERTKQHNVRQTEKIKIYLDQLIKWKKITGLEIQNEIGFNLTDYINFLEKDLLVKTQQNNFIYGKNLLPKFELDEDYKKINMLSDGCYGLTDFYNNWFIASAENIVFEIKIDEDIRKAKTIKLSFLKDKKHNIFPPEKIIVSINDSNYNKELTLDGSIDLQILNVEIPINITEFDSIIILKINKQPKYLRNQLAIDEIRLQ